MTQIDHVTTSPPKTTTDGLTNQEDEIRDSQSAAPNRVSDISLETSELQMLAHSERLLSQ